jgi:RNA polymerase sigma-70 factor (ECF subfamily)
MAELMKCIRTLAPEEQELLRLRYVADLSFAEMAELLLKSESAVKKSFYRLLARLQSQLEA